ncbi:MAG: hypothetical protein HETSPECPRED_008743 [Heterodermia speciosa]|uniref:Prion-inhibition and propagation HeLo domain-containing protein n=1 Tax=Heterodermia speciosa TaxID=116794 RepID=A0A8H3IV55_9LECA|nr:MAG: hypothetical protein HETSPECPRED_008743 [Heterodermia speciosa]
MEIAGLTISVAGLATLFDLCLRGFDLLEQGKDFSRDHTILMARLNAQRKIFTIWGEAVGLSASKDLNYDNFSSDSELRTVVKTHLDCISLIFEDAAQLSKKYGLKPTENGSPRTPTQPPFRSYLGWFQKHTSRRRKAKWAIRDLAKFKSMLDDLGRLITDLRDITSSLADVKHQREVFVTEVVDQLTDIEDLEVIEEALSQEDPTLSSAASERRTVLTQTAFTVRSLAGPSAHRYEDDDMHTHADLDPGAQLSDLTDTSSDELNEVQLEDEETPCEISAKYGHQNNLSEIQRIDLMGLARFCPLFEADPSPSTLSSHGCKWVLRELRRFHESASETPFISIGFADVGNECQLVDLSSHHSMYLLTFQDHLIGRFQAPVSRPRPQMLSFGK